VFKAIGCEPLPRGTHVRVRITGTDALTLEVHASLVARLDDAAPPSAEAEEEADDADQAEPLALALDVGDGDTTEAPVPAPSPV
jgi:exoribonuclease-2